MEQEDNKIVNFWNWFRINKDKLRSENISAELIKILNEKILDLGDFNWEVREGVKKENMFIISPGGDFSLFENTQKIIYQAPLLADWEFYHYKPAKKWDYRISFYHDSIRKIIDVSLWEYVLYKFKDDTFDILLKANNVEELSEEEKYTFADIVLESILGEKESLTYIKNIEFVHKFDEGIDSKKNYITVLKSHFEQMKN